MFHTIAILITGLLVSKIQQPSMHWAGWLFLIGIILFSGSLYTYAVSGAKLLAMITPFGGIMFLAAWVVLGYSVMKLDRKSTRLNSSHVAISYAVFCLKKKKKMM